MTETIAKNPQVTTNNDTISFAVHFHQVVRLTCDNASAPIKIAEVGVMAVINPDDA